MSRSTECILTNMCMVTSGTKVLVQIRNDPNWGGAAFPGGHVEHGESFCASVIREVKEETGLTVESPKLVGIKNWFKKSGKRSVVLLYRADRFSGDLRSSDEGEVMWVERDELPKMRLASTFSDMLKVFEEDGVSEMYWAPDAGDDDVEYL